MNGRIKNVSVILPTYNSAEYLRASINSILNQTFKNFEFIIVDDGSEDQTEEVVNSFNDSRIKYIKKDHSGVGDSYNLGIENSSYDWIARMDSDDIALPTRLEEEIKFLEKSECNLISCWYAVFYNNKIQYLVKPESKGEIIKKNLLLHTGMINAGIMFNKKIIPPEGFINESIEDHEMFLRIHKTLKPGNVEKVLMLYRFRSNSYSRSKHSNYDRRMYNILGKYYNKNLADFNIESQNKLNEIKGWREYFYGNKSEARKFWIKDYILLKKMKILIAYLFTFIPNRYFYYLKEFRLKFRIKYYLKYFSQEAIVVRKLFKGIEK